MVYDILAILISTIAAKSIFSTCGHIPDYTKVDWVNLIALSSGPQYNVDMVELLRMTHLGSCCINKQ
ncbi:hypothetical protein EJ110_NYTH33569 [Nymphaea thermarum]|nr:hypothetical protein EJ110_NYTH33569 [Nymphaea thermarum]